MKNQVLFIILEAFADYEYPFLACALQEGIQGRASGYEAKTVSVHKSPVRSIGGVTVLPDYSVTDCPADYAALILIGGTAWRTEEAKKVSPILKQAFADEKIIGAICDATVFLGMNGLLNGKKHTSNTLESLREGAKEHYTGENNYQNEQAVRDGNLITANGTAALEFCKEVLTALDAFPAELIEANYQFFKIGFVEMMNRLHTTNKLNGGQHEY